MYCVESLEKIAGYGNSSKNALSALLKALQDENAGPKIDAAAREGKSFRDPATGVR
jgi:hypothetical protein